MSKIEADKNLEKKLPEDPSLNSEPEVVKVEDEIATDGKEGKKNVFSRLREKIKKKKEASLKKVEEELASEDKEKVNEKLDQVETKAKRKDSKKQKIISILLLIFNIALVVALLLWNILGDGEFTPLSSLTIYPLQFLIYLLLIFICIFFDVFSAWRMLYKKTRRSRWPLSFKSMGVLRYYDSVIPFSGGEALTVQYLRSRDVPGSTALSIPVAKFIFQQLSWIIISLFCIIFSQFTADFYNYVSITGIIGFVLASGSLFVIMFLSLSKGFGKKVVSWVLKLLCKMKILKDYEKQYEKVWAFVEDYQNIMREYSKSIWDVILQLFLHAGRYIISYSMPFFVYCIFRGFPVANAGELYGIFFISSALIELSSSFIPLPGGSGMSEISFSVIFSQFLDGQTFWALLLWRFSTYYIYLLQGIGIIAYDTVYGNRKYEWIKKKMELQQESQIFKKTQIDNFRAERNKRRKKEKSKKLLNK